VLAPLVLGASALLGACAAAHGPPATPTSAAPSLAATAAAGARVADGASASDAGGASGLPTPTPTLIPPKPTVTPTPKPLVPTPTPSAAPEALEIPKIGVSAPIKGVGTRGTGEMDAPSSPSDVGWFLGGPKPGEPGNAILTGHLDWAGPPPRPAVFWRLKELVPGDEIQVRTAQGPLTFTVESTTLYDRASAPVDRILGWAMGKVITIVTCEGQFIPRERDYTHRRVIRARLG
jgi:sortase (surface protein transpeptidase)